MIPHILLAFWALLLGPNAAPYAHQIMQQAMVNTNANVGALPFTLVTHSGALSTNNNSVTTAGVNTTGANFIFLGVSQYVAPSAPTDSYSNTWIALTTYTIMLRNITGYYCIGCVVGTGHTFSVSSVGTYPGVCMIAASGVKSTSPQDGSTVGNTGSTISLQPGSITPSMTDLFVTALFSDSSTAPTISAGFTATDSNGDISTALGNACGYGISASTQNPTWSFNSGLNATTMAAFLP